MQRLVALCGPISVEVDPGIRRSVLEPAFNSFSPVLLFPLFQDLMIAAFVRISVNVTERFANT